MCVRPNLIDPDLAAAFEDKGKVNRVRNLGNFIPAIGGVLAKIGQVESNLPPTFPVQENGAERELFVRPLAMPAVCCGVGNEWMKNGAAAVTISPEADTRGESRKRGTEPNALGAPALAIFPGRLGFQVQSKPAVVSVRRTACVGGAEFSLWVVGALILEIKAEDAGVRLLQPDGV